MGTWYGYRYMIQPLVCALKYSALIWRCTLILGTLEPFYAKKKSNAKHLMLENDDSLGSLLTEDLNLIKDDDAAIENM